MEGSQKGERPWERTHEAARQQRRVDRYLRRLIEQRVSDTGVYRSQHQLLMHLGRCPGCSQARLAEIMEISPAAITNSLKKLEKGGYITRQMNREDNRVNQPEITPKGLAVIEQSRHIFQEIDRGMYAGFTEQELCQLQEFYGRIIQNLSTQLEKEAEN